MNLLLKFLYNFINVTITNLRQWGTELKSVGCEFLDRRTCGPSIIFSLALKWCGLFGSTAPTVEPVHNCGHHKHSMLPQSAVECSHQRPIHQRRGPNGRSCAFRQIVGTSLYKCTQCPIIVKLLQYTAVMTSADSLSTSPSKWPYGTVRRCLRNPRRCSGFQCSQGVH